MKKNKKIKCITFGTILHIHLSPDIATNSLRLPKLALFINIPFKQQAIPYRHSWSIQPLPTAMSSTKVCVTLPRLYSKMCPWPLAFETKRLHSEYEVKWNSGTHTSQQAIVLCLGYMQ